MNEIKRIILMALLAVVSVPLFAQSKTEGKAYPFRFVKGNDMFFVPYAGNNKVLEELTATLEKQLQRLRDGQIYIRVSSYAASSGQDMTARKMAYLRNLRVKSELITRAGVTEAMFVTDRHIPSAYGADSLRDVVVITFPSGIEKIRELVGTEAAAKAEAYNHTHNKVSENPQAEVVSTDKKAGEVTVVKEEESIQSELPESRTTEEALQGELVSLPVKPYTLSLRANLLRWATLTPDLGLEWRISRDWAVLVNGSWTSWSWDDKNRRYALWKVAPEVRYYIGKEKHGYLGVMYKVGSFNYKLSETGRQGDLMGGGITGGYQLRLNKALALDFTLGLGCIHADYDKYTVIDGVRVKQGKESKNWWGPVNAGVTLMWNLF